MLVDKYDWRSLDTDWPVVGVDEVGRGCLAGPVYAGAVLLNQDKPWSHYTDSKKLSAERRECLSSQIYKDHWVGIGSAHVDEIMKYNILQASLLAMKRAVINLCDLLGLRKVHLLIDGNQILPGFSLSTKINNQLWSFKQTSLVKGDLRAEPVAAASIVAKVTRDRLLTELSQKYPGYGLDIHKGYATAAHRKAIAQLGPSDIHRLSFAGVKEHRKQSK